MVISDLAEEFEEKEPLFESEIKLTSNSYSLIHFIENTHFILHSHCSNTWKFNDANVLLYNSYNSVASWKKEKNQVIYAYWISDTNVKFCRARANYSYSDDLILSMKSERWIFALLFGLIAIAASAKSLQGVHTTYLRIQYHWFIICIYICKNLHWTNAWSVQ